LGSQLSSGEWSTLNPTTTSGAQPVDNTAAPNGDTWEQGNNYVLFENVEADANGEIIFNSLATPTYRLPLSGWQLREVAIELITLTIAPASSPASGFDLSWGSKAGMLYRIRGNADLSTPPSTWPVVAEDIAATPDTNVYNVSPGGPRLFYAVEGYPAPPVAIYSETFDTTLAGSLPDGWTSGKNPADNSSTSNWELGTPANVGPVPPGVPLPSASNCVATDIASNYDDPPSDLGVAHTDIWLRTPAIDLGAATEGTLVFQQWTEIEDVPGDLDYGSIRILDASDDSELATMENRTIDGNTSGWEEYSMELPAEAFTATGGTIKVEWHFEADDIVSFAGSYIDDVTVTVTEP
jgi:hypothetical protein